MDERTSELRPSVAEEEISLRDIAATLGRQKKIISGCIAVTTLIGLLYAIFATPLYTATVTVAPATQEEGGLSSMASRLGGVAGLAGINLGGGASDREEYLATLRSRELAVRFIERYELKPHLFPERWDAEAGKWKGGEPGILERIRRVISRALASLSGDKGWQPPGIVPTASEAYKKFDAEIREISENAQTGIVTVFFQFSDPLLAAQWANNYVAMANQEIREDAVREASRALEYLTKEVEETSVAGLRDTLYNVVESQLERITLANTREEYAFKVLDAAVAPEEHSHPRRGLIVILSLILGGVLGVSLALASAVYTDSVRRAE